jgi:hypothetical protein
MQKQPPFGENGTTHKEKITIVTYGSALINYLQNSCLDNRKTTITDGSQMKRVSEFHSK